MAKLRPPNYIKKHLHHYKNTDKIPEFVYKKNSQTACKFKSRFDLLKAYLKAVFW